MALETITTHGDGAVARLVAQYRGKARFEALVRALTTGVQGVENAIGSLIDTRLLDSAEAAQLDVLGGIVGVARAGRTDEPYRTRIRVQIRLNRVSGTGPELLDLFVLLIGTANPLVLEEQYPAGFTLRVEGALPIAAADALAVLRAGRGAAISGHLAWIETTEGASFSFEDGPGLGFGDSGDASAGGALSGEAG